MKQYTVNELSSGARVDVYVAEQLPEFSRASLRSLFDKGFININGGIEKAGYKLKAGDIVNIDASLLYTQPQNIDLPVVYEDGDVVVMDKPAGVLTHSKGALNTEATVASFLSEKINDKGLIGNRAGIVHRLDRPTSGVIIGAKNSGAMTKLQKQFSQRKTKKTYYAVVEGTPKPAEAIIDAPIERNPSKPQSFRVGANGKPAQTNYNIIKSFKKNGHIYSQLKLQPLTGRTHQLRVHLKYIGHPIVGDRTYGHDGEMLLHAASLELTLPSGERRVFKVDLPKVFKDFIDEK